jgi:hypothetical protein
VKEALVHLALITLGVLIALSFEGLASWREHRALVREARANLASEIRDNLDELSNRLKKIPDEQRNIDRARQAVARLAEHHKLDMKSLELSFVTAELRDASHVTAQITGAFALMEYDEVKKYSGLYGKQAMYMRLHTDAFQNLSRTLGFVDILGSEAPAARELDDFRQQLRLLGAALTLEEQIGRALLDEYKRVLQP